MQYASLDQRHHASTQVGIIDREADPVLNSACADRRLRADGDEEQARNTKMRQSAAIGMLLRPANEYDIGARVPGARDKVGLANGHALLILHPVVMCYYNLSFTRR